jgi:hypothetical protein
MPPSARFFVMKAEHDKHDGIVPTRDSAANHLEYPSASIIALAKSFGASCGTL